MLKALELVGFKSFADRTRFEFPPGITVVVGPNGSGKSNVVDAIKWVLGEQSVKSLRGKEMSDVIFNGSGSRGLLNSAEATLTFDNANGLLAIDSPDVHISRRVYRSGEGEYLINRQPCRLRDIRQLFSGTGAATEAYSVIEQGKVDILLQSSPRDRRMIFEEAAGISRFKAKKIESLRRLERVEQNLLRLADIVEEVDNQLRNVRKQAGKAQRYQEYSQRLRHLRLHVGVVDWRHHQLRQVELSEQLTTLRGQVAETGAAIEAHEQRGLELERWMIESGQTLAEAEGRIAESREQIASQEASIEHHLGRLRDLEQEQWSLATRFLTLSARGGDLEIERQSAVSEIVTCETLRTQLASEQSARQGALNDLNRILPATRKRHEDQRAAYMNLMRQAAGISNQISAREQQVAALFARRERIAASTAEIERQLAAHLAEHGETKTRWHASQAQLEERTAAWSAAKQRLADLQHEFERLAGELAGLRERGSAARERATVLQELEDRFEGIGAGAKEVLLLAREAGEGPLKQVRGLIADLFHVSLDMAAVLDAALGPATQFLVLGPGPAFYQFLEGAAYRFPGRVGFVRLDAPARYTAHVDVDLSRQPGVLGRADQFVETTAELRPLAERMLGRTWIVERLSRAIELSQQIPDVEFVTLAGEVVGSDGTITVGPRQSVGGLVSRRSELRALRQQLGTIENQVREQETAITALKQRITRQSSEVDARSREQGRAQSEAAELRTQFKELSHREARWLQQKSTLESEDGAAERDVAEATTMLDAARQDLSATEAQLGAMDGEINQAATEMERHEHERREQTQRLSDLGIRQAKTDEQIAGLRMQLARLNDSQQERQRVLDEHCEQQAQQAERVQQSMRAVLQIESALAEQYLRKEQREAERTELVRRRDSQQRERLELSQTTHRLRSEIRQREETMHGLELAEREIELEFHTIAGRLRDDYQIELAEIVANWQGDEPGPRDEIEAEIAELRRKINHIGSVNLDALAELEELEGRHQLLSGQYQDLAQAKASLEQIINRINADSRRLLTETFETVRGHFLELFEKLFGGGHADLLLEPGVDILESGVEIVARPPGKEPRSISLLSGGEKTLTCVAILLAVFRSRPSPFCVLDEVDAALDEANIERFVSVLKEFLTWTQFIIITHSKRTMTCAQTLYGVTMQESGVSKRVSVRFEDVSDTGEILSPARAFADDTASEEETQAA